MSDTPQYILDFIKATCPDAPGLYLASFNEEHCLIDATARINNLARELSVAQSQLAEEKKLTAAISRDCNATALERNALRDKLAKFERDAERLREWLDANTSFYDVDANWPVDGHNIPTLAQINNRIWYHATDDEKSFPFSKVVDAAINGQEGK